MISVLIAEKWERVICLKWNNTRRVGTIDRTMLRIYTYSKCSTCRNALQWLQRHEIPFTEIAIREQPPSRVELKQMQNALEGQGMSIRALFNTAGQDYRALNLKVQLPGMSRDEAFALLSSNGNLVKRPFAMDPEEEIFLVGFDESKWADAFRSKT